MTQETLQRILSKLRLEIYKQELFLTKVSRIQSQPTKAREDIIRDVCWIDGTLATQTQYAIQRRTKLVAVRDKLIRRWFNAQK